MLNSDAPFIGYLGIGSRVELIERADELILRESRPSGWMTLALLASVSIFPLVLIVFFPSQLKGGQLATWSLGLSAAVSLPLLVTFLIKFKCRKIFFRRQSQTIEFNDWKLTSARSKLAYSFSAVNRVGFLEVSAGNRSLRKASARSNYLLVLSLRNGDEITLCCTDDEAELRRIHQSLNQLIGPSSV